MTASPYSAPEIKRNAWYFLAGKAVTAALTFAILLMVVRMLPIVEYGIYVTAVAGIELLIAVAASGFSWTAHRYIPEYRLHAPGLRTEWLVYRLFWLTAGVLAAIGLLLYWKIDAWLGWARLGGYVDVARIALLWLVVEGTWRFIRDAILGPLLLQGRAQICMVIRSGAMLLFLINHAVHGSLDLRQLIWAEVLASLLAMVVATGALRLSLKGLRDLPAKEAWSEPGFPVMALTGGHMLSAQLLALLYSPQILLLIVQRFLGIESAAVFGFMRSLYEQIGRYLPATLLFTVIRPKLVASFVGGGAAREANMNANMAGKISLFVLMPLIAFAGIAGQDVIGILSGNKWPDTGLLFAGFMLVLIPFSQQQLLETLAVVTGNSVLCIRAAGAGLLVPLVLYGLIRAGLGLWAPIIALGVGHLLYNGAIVVGLLNRIGYVGDPVGIGKMLVAAFAAFGIAAVLPITGAPVFEVAVNGVVVACIFLFAAWVAKPFGASERARLNGLFRSRWFVW